MKNKNISRACLAAALVMAGTVSAHASALRSSAPETEAAVMIMDNTRMARPKAKIVKEYAPTNRPAESERLFRSEAVEAEIARIKGVLSNAKLAWMFENCFPNTLDTTVRYRKDDNGRDDTVVYTGDIHAMWLRDSGAQVWPYLQLANKDEHLRSMLAGVIRRQFKCIELDPYANAFLDPYDPNPDHQWMSDQTQMRPELHERKWEIDSLCYPLRLAYEYWLVTGDDSVFDEHWMAAIEHTQDLPRAAAQGGCRPLYVHACDRPPARYGLQHGQGQSGESRRADRFGIPSLGRCDDVPLSRAFEFLCRDFAAQGCRNPDQS